MARTPIKKFAEQEGVTDRFLYMEVKAGRLVLTKVGSRTFVDDADAEDWRALAPKVTGPGITTQAAERHIEHLGRMVAKGRIDRAHATERLAAAARKAGLLLEPASAAA
jgi:hypothetical protein